MEMNHYGEHVDVFVNYNDTERRHTYIIQLY